MSLLNDMLRDLSHRNPATVSMNHDSNELLQQTRLVKSSKASWFSAIVIFVLIFFLVVAIRQFTHKISASNNVIAAPAKVIEADIKKNSNVNAPVIADVQAPVSISNEEKSAQVSARDVPLANTHNLLSDDSKNISRIDDLLRQANRALNMDRLTSPIEDNAYGYYQKILVIDPNQDEALKGIEVIADRYLAKAHEQLQFGNNQQADVLIERARFVAAEYSDTYLSTDTFNKVDNQLVAQHQFTQIQPLEQSSIASNDTIDATVQEPRQIVSPVTQRQSESIKSLPIAEATPMTVTPNAAWKDEQIAQQARELLQQGKIPEAQTLLKKFIASEQKPIQSTIVLGDIYFQQNNFQAVEILANAANYLSDVEKAKMKAQLLSNQGKEVEAVGVLEQYINAADSSESYRALLASLYHKTGNYQKSIVSYQRLLNSYGEKPAYWLGVALAYDGLSQNNNALQAYLHLREFPQLQDQVKTYIEQRITALRGQ